MPRIPWSARAIQSKCVALQGKRTLYTFDGVERLALECHANRRRNWLLRYQVFINGKRTERKLHLGILDPEQRRNGKADDLLDVLTSGQARDKAQAILSQVRAGGDPWLDLQQRKLKCATELTFNDAFWLWVNERHPDDAPKPRTRKGYLDLYRIHVELRLGKYSLGDIDKALLKNAVAEIQIASTDPQKNHRGLQATKALDLVRQVLQWAEENDHVSHNVARGIRTPVPKKNPAGKCSRPLTEEELRRVWHAAPQYCWKRSALVIRLSFVIGKRLSEIVGALKSEIRLDNKIMLIPGHRVGNKSNKDEVVPLPDLAVSILAEAMVESGDSAFVFPGRFNHKKHMDRGTPSGHLQDILDKLGIEGRVRFHDSRSLINDQMAKMQIPTEYRSHVLHHTGDMRGSLVNDTYSTYDFSAEKREALELREKRLLEIIEGREPTSLNWRMAKSRKVEELTAKLDWLIEQQQRHQDSSSSE